MGNVIPGGFDRDTPEVTIFEGLEHITGRGPVVETCAPVVSLGGQVLRAAEEVSREVLISEAVDAITGAQSLVQAELFGEEVPGGDEALEAAYERQDEALAKLSAQESEMAYNLWRESLSDTDA